MRTSVIKKIIREIYLLHIGLNGLDIISPDDIKLSSRNKKHLNEALLVLQAKNCIKLELDCDGCITYLHILPKCIAYFEDKKENTNNFWRSFFTNFFSGILVGVIVTLVAQYLLISFGLVH